jgi:hypothetical protein
LGLLVFYWGSNKNQRIYLSAEAKALPKEEVLKLALALERGRNFVSAQAVPTYIATRGYTDAIDQALTQFKGLLTSGEFERYKNTKYTDLKINQENGDNVFIYRTHNGRGRIELEIPGPFSFYFKPTLEQITALIKVLSTGEGDVVISREP